jgi:hypothetical protein
MFWLDTAIHAEALVSDIEILENALQPGLQMCLNAATRSLLFPERYFYVKLFRML